jgi:hypothetical protein
MDDDSSRKNSDYKQKSRSETQYDLKSILPREAIKWYIDHRRDEVRMPTRRKHESSLGTFVDWTDEVSIEDMNELGGRRLMAYKTWLKTESDLATISLNGNLAILQRFLRFCERSRPSRRTSPTGPRSRTSRRRRKSTTRSRQTTKLSRFRHTTGNSSMPPAVRSSSISSPRWVSTRRSLWDRSRGLRAGQTGHPSSSRTKGAEEYGTPLKNGPDGERIINISDQLRDFIVDYVEQIRDDVFDQYGRRPLFTTANGRPSTATIRRDFYKMSRPCEYSGGCPHDREIAECDAAKNANAADCPSRFSTHPLRKWAIMSQLNAGVPKELLSDRVDVSVPVLDKHYDQRTEERKSRHRHEALKDNLEQYAIADGKTVALNGVSNLRDSRQGS